MKNILQLSIIGLFFFGFTNCNQAQQKATQEKTTVATESTSNSEFITTSTGEKIAKVMKSDSEWKAELDGNEYDILRHAGTERAFSGDLWDNKKEGTYVCRGCQFPLFKSDTKFKSGTGWPSYYQPVNDYCVAEKSDDKFGWKRVEVLCARCDGHLGHVFEDGPKPTGLRYCINSASLDFVEK